MEMKKPKVMQANFPSKCLDEWERDRELCDGIAVGDEIIFFKGYEVVNYPIREAYTSVGHVECRIAEHKKTQVAWLVQFLVDTQKPLGMTGGAIEEAAQDFHDKWAASQGI
jgi:hypothetical protein